MQLDSVGGEGSTKYQCPPDQCYLQISSSRPNTKSDSFIQLQRPNDGNIVLTFNQIPPIHRTFQTKKCLVELLLKLFLLLILSQSLLTAAARKYVNPGACSKSRAVFNAPWGIIEDGPAQYNYTKNTHCEWLVNGTASNFISLKFQTMSTECSYDYVFVHDGQTFDSPLLGSFSGKTLPQSVVASSGYLLVILYSDTNYVLEGFRAEYSLTDCPHNCTDKGDCVKGVCHCNEKYAGDDCSLALCPDECGKSASRGKCVSVNGLHKCKCNSGFVGDDCSLDLQNYVGNTWSSVSRQGPDRLSPRTSHSSAYDPDHDRLYVYGGFDLNTVTDQFNVYDFQDNSWSTLSPDRDYDSRRWSLDKGGRNSLYPERQPVFQTTQSGIDNNSVEIKSSKQRQITFAKTKNSTVAVKFLPPVPRRGDTLLDSSDISDSEDYETTDYNTLLRHRRTPMMQEKLLLPKIKEVDRSSLNPPQRPPALRGHKMIKISGGILLYGGKLVDGTVTNALWLYNITSGLWSLQAGDSSVRPTPVWQHTLNLAGDHLYAFGGSTVSGRFVSDMFRISVDVLREWEAVEVRGGKALDIRVTGHTCIYHQKSHSLFVYGGILTDVARFSKLSDRLFNFNLDSQTWTEVHYPKTSQRPGSSVPREMAFHTASVVGNYMIIFGGYSHRHNQDEVCYSSSLYLYQLDCQIWVHHEAMEHTPPGTQYPKTQGVFGHSTEVRNGSELIVIGGYHGTVNGDVLGYKLPSTIASEITPCELYGSYTSCTANPKCGWCGSSGKCHQSNEPYKCQVSNLQSSSCPGICPALTTCYSCTTHGRNGCEWCVHTAKCHEKGSLYGCPKEAYGKPEPWWGDPVKIVSADACRTNTNRPGLTLTKYRYPPNFDLPDSVEIVNSSKVIFTHPSPLQEREIKMGGEFTVRLAGVIRPRPDRNKPVEQLEACIGFATAFLKMTFNPPPERPLESILNISHPLPASSTTSKYPACYQASWPNSEDAIHLYPGTAYPFEFLARRNASNMVYHHVQNSVILLRNSSQAKQNHIGMARWSSSNLEYTVDSLEPYKNGSCYKQTNCKNCLVDSLCGWCSSTSMCLLRQDATCPVRLTIVPEQCVNCSDHIYCSSCVDDSSCEWIVDEARCARHSRFPGALSDPASCPMPCHQRTNCTSCLDTGRCVWCDSTQECFLFSVYTSEFQYGGCRQWFDKPHSDGVELIDGGLAQCKMCEIHQNCSTCLQDLGCGWCYSEENPTIGSCVLGDFNAPSIGMCPLLLGSNNTSLNGSTVKWAYDSCPDINECVLNVHECHENATCQNVYGSYKCNCDRGFAGDGFSSCNQTCYEQCVHGWCSGAPQYECKCELGWTGKDCDTNCGCNNHSTCVTGVGKCDKCVEHTRGEFCQLCLIGTFGNATATTGCEPCQCNEHEDIEKGICEEETGMCYCTDNTEGNHCQKCKPGFFGNSLEGGQCHYNCGSRVLISGVNDGSFGVHREDSDENSLRECLWIVAVAEGLSFTSDDFGRVPGSKGTGLIQLTFENSMNVTCPDNYVYVYDGLPPIVSNKISSNILGTFCTQELIQEKLELEAESGFLSVLYTEDIASSGFNASFSLVTCPNYCSGNSSCVGSRCVCQEGWTGMHCTTPICPNSCSAQLLQGTCNKARGLCICEEGFGGQDCATKLKPSDIVYTDLFRLEKVPNSNKNSHLPRLGHTMVSDTNGIIWMFGGLSQSRGPLNDVRAFDTRNNSWKLLTVNTKETGNGAGDSVYPAGRYFHAATFSPFTKNMYVHGGMDLHTHFADFWMLDVVKQRWTSLDAYHEKNADTLDTSEGLLRKREPRAKLSDQTPKLAGHTMTLNSDSETLVIIGGFSPDGGFNQHVLEYDLKSSSWQRLDVGGFGPVGIYGHSCVYHAATQSFYVFGGLVFDVDKTKVSSRLWCFNYHKKRWSVLPFESATSQTVPAYLQPSHTLEGRMLHTAIATDHYMLIMGGRTTPETRRGTSYALYELAAYVFDCNQWLNNPLILMWNYKATRVRYVGKPIPPGYGLASARTRNGDIYLMGGISVTLRGNLKKLSLPSDLCNLFGENRHVCRNTPGCDYCSLHRPDGGNSTFCYTSSGPKPKGCRFGEFVPEITPGIECVRKWEDQPSKRKRSVCDGYKSCSDCLAEWPNRENSSLGPPCQWCSGCARGKCIPKGKDCRREHPCHLRQDSIRDSGKCPELECSAADCDKCVDWEGAKCAWTRQVERSSEMRKEISHWTDLHNWNCVKQSRSLMAAMAVLGSGNSSAISSPPMPCPPRCNVYKNCGDCLEATGAEGGHQTCHWSTRINKCISPAYKPLKCVGGICGKVLTSWKDVCPLSCPNYTECRVCLQQVGCGWCSVDSQPTTGLGICTDGTLEGPKGGACSALNYSVIAERNEKSESAVEYYPPRAKKQGSGLANVSPLTFVTSWHYAKCPPENECLNNHHTCHLTSERCVDREEGFECKCNVGYQTQNDACIPVCDLGCRNGTCVAPNKCKCEFGYVGVTCDSRCNCNGHSKCPGPEDLDTCTKCENNTMGDHCELCKPAYVGDPGSGEKCISCNDYCSGHSSHCYSKDMLLALQNSTTSTWPIIVPTEEDENYVQFENSTLEYLNHITEQGPRQEAICLNCVHETMGPRCHQCIAGHFRGSTNLETGCRPCHCNLHGNICDPITGGECKCSNHTETEPNVCSAKRSSSAGSSKDCWKSQCTKCKEYYLGDPIEGHQCYRTMSVDQENCFDPTSQSDCNGKPGPLKPGHAIFFAVQPKFMNVDIRVLVDVTQGAVDVLISSESQMFVVETNKSTFFHEIKFDPNFPLNLNLEDFESKAEAPVFVVQGKDRREDNLMFTLYGKERWGLWPGVKKLMKLDGDSNGIRRNLPQLASNVTPSSSRNTFDVREIEANGLVTFISMKKQNEVLYIKNLGHRLVVSLPETSHDLRSSKFYIVVHGSKSKQADMTFGSIFFRQDQLHIDLFVFFSVFFSCFFLFLAACVLFWKMKQVSDLRRARTRHALEMTVMARRPFATLNVLISEEPSFIQNFGNSPLSQKRAKNRLSAMCTVHQHNTVRDVLPTKRLLEPEPKHYVRAVAVEPLSDGIVAVTTVLVQQPGAALSGSSSLCLGSALVNTLRVFPNSKILKRPISNAESR